MDASTPRCPKTTTPPVSPWSRRLRSSPPSRPSEPRAKALNRAPQNKPKRQRRGRTAQGKRQKEHEAKGKPGVPDPHRHSAARLRALRQRPRSAVAAGEPRRFLHVEVADPEGVGFDEGAPRFDHVS